MSRRKTRTITGFAATTFVGFGLAMAAPAAMADTMDLELLDSSRQPLDTLDLPADGAETTLDYHCATTDGIDESTESMSVGVSAPEAAETGETIQVSGGSDSFFYYYPGEEVAEGAASIDVEFQLAGDAAPTDSVTFSMTNTEAFNPGDGEISWSEAEVAELDLKNPGDLEFVSGTVSTSIDQATGATTTECDPVEAATIYTTSVTGDPIEDDDDEDDQDPPEDDDDEDEDEDDQDPPEDDDEDEQKPPEEDDGEDDGEEDDADGGLPVTGAALGGLVAAAVAALGGGGGAMYLARKRRNAASTEE